MQSRPSIFYRGIKECLQDRIMYSAPYHTTEFGSAPYAYAAPTYLPINPGGYSGYYHPDYISSSVPRAHAKGHSRRASHEPSSGYDYISTRTSPGYATIGKSSSGQYYFTSPQHTADYVNDPDRFRSKSASYRSSGSNGGALHRGVPSSHYTYRQPYESSEEDIARNFAYTVPQEQSYRQSYRHTEHYRVNDEQAPSRAEAETSSAKRSRARRPSNPPRPATSPKASKPTKSSKSRSPTSTPARKSTAPPVAEPPAPATDDDRIRLGIPAGYSLKNWDPTETPVLLLGSVFDANSLGKWIYDWTVFHHGPATPMSEIAGDFWLLLIQLAGKVKRAEECLGRVRKRSNREMLGDFLESGDRLWDRFAKLLKACETSMYQAARRESKGDRKAGITMGQSSGCAFVDSLFGRDCEFEKTEKLMTGMRLWSMRFDANCDEILRQPNA